MEPRAAWGAGIVLVAALAAGAWPAGVEGPAKPGCDDGELVELRGASGEPGAFGPPWLVCEQRLGEALAARGCAVAPPQGSAVALGDECRVEAVVPSAGPSLLLGRPVNVNEAGLEDLEMLPGIGTGLARRIVSVREHDGPFGSLVDLRRVKGLGPSRIRALEGWAVAGAANAR